MEEKKPYFRWMGRYDPQAGGRQTTMWYCDDEAARSQCQAVEELHPGDILKVADPPAVYTVNTRGEAKLQSTGESGGGGSGEGGPADHRRLAGRDAADQHPMSAITGLTQALAKAPTTEQLDEALRGKQDVLSGKPGQIVGFGPNGEAIPTDIATNDEVNQMLDEIFRKT